MYWIVYQPLDKRGGTVSGDFIPSNCWLLPCEHVGVDVVLAVLDDMPTSDTVVSLGLTLSCALCSFSGDSLLLAFTLGTSWEFSAEQLNNPWLWPSQLSAKPSPSSCFFHALISFLANDFTCSLPHPFRRTFTERPMWLFCNDNIDYHKLKWSDKD